MNRLFIKSMSVTIVVVALSMSICSCGNKNGGDDEEVREIALTSPENNATIDLSNVANVNFTWTQLEGVSGYTLKFSPTEAGLASTSVTIDAGNVGAYNLTSAAADNFLATNTSAPPGEAIDIYWTVTPSTATSNVKNAVRKFNVKRLPTPVIPALDVSTGSLVFQANPAGAQSVEITSNIAWNVSVEPSGWLVPAPVSGSGNGSISFTVSANTGAARNATVTVSGTGVDAKIISVVQAAADGGNTSDLFGTWNMETLESVREGPHNIKAYATAKYASTFTLNSNGTFTGEIPYLSNEGIGETDNATRSWTYANGVFTFNIDEYQNSYRATVTASELIFETGTAGNAGYYKAVFTKNAVAIPPIPNAISPYTGNASTFHGVWVLTKTEDNNCNLDGSNPRWWEVSISATAEAMKLTVNADGTYSIVSKMDNSIQNYSGTWTYSNGILTTVTNGETNSETIDAASNASTLIWGSIDVDTYSKTYSRMTFTKVN